MMLRGALTTLFNAAVHTRPAQFFISHSGKIGGASFALGDALLIGKDYFLTGRVPNAMEQTSGLIFLLADAGLALMDRHPRMRVPTGLMILLGAATLGYSGMGSPAQNSQMFGSALIGGQGLSLIFEDGLHNFAQRREHSGSKILRTLFRPLAKYPVSTTSAIDIALSKTSLAYAAIVKRDAGLLIGCLLWILGDCGVIASDKSFKSLLQDKNTPTPQAPLSPSPQVA